MKMRACVTAFALTLLLFATDSSFGQTEIGRNIEPIEKHGRISWEDEKQRLDAFAQRLKSEPQMIGYIYIREAQISCEGAAVAYAIELKKYLVQEQDLSWNRVAWRDLGYGPSFEVSFWLFPAGEPPKYQPEYQLEATNIEDCDSLIRRSRWEAKRRTMRRAANKRLERTRR